MDNHSKEQKQVEINPGQLEYAKSCVINARGNKKKFHQGLTMLQQAANNQNPEALFILARLTLDKYLRPAKGSFEQHGMKLLYLASAAGSLQARVMLNEMCQKNYEQDFNLVKDRNVTPHPLLDFEGKPIVIQKTGLFTPIDAVLEFKEEQNVLTFRCNLDFLNLYAAEDEEKFKAAVIKGIKAWEGEYEVFGAQQLSVKLEITAENRLFDNVLIYLMNEEGRKLIEQAAENVGKLGAEKTQERMEDIAMKKNSFATIGRKWSVKSRKVIFIAGDDSKEDFYEEIAQITTHEFGHALGLGDLYQCSQYGMQGVQRGTYEELDCYAVSENAYHLIMCNQYGMISNNDIEMIVLAFSENARQNYQPDKRDNKISEALGKGN